MKDFTNKLSKMFPNILSNEFFKEIQKDFRKKQFPKKFKDILMEKLSKKKCQNFLISLLKETFKNKKKNNRIATKIHK